MEIALGLGFSVLLVLFLMGHAAYSSHNRKKALELIPGIFNRHNSIDSEDLRTLLKAQGVPLSKASLKSVMSQKSAHIELCEAQNKINGKTVMKIRYRRKFGVTMPGGTIGVIMSGKGDM